MTDRVEARLKELGLVLPSAAAPAANYEPYAIAKGLIFIAGQAPLVNGKPTAVGRVGAEVSLTDAVAAARVCGLNVLAQVKAAVNGDWGRLQRCVRLCGYVSSAADFYDQPKVVDGASDLMVAVLGPAGRHSRSAMGAYVLRANVPVVVDAVFELVD
jgi:enamine deaminase RidA (YjgF/YER057c/UK114 family)